MKMKSLTGLSFIRHAIYRWLSACVSLGLVSRIDSATLWRMHCPIGNSAELYGEKEKQGVLVLSFLLLVIFSLPASFPLSCEFLLDTRFFIILSLHYLLSLSLSLSRRSSPQL